MCVSVKFMDKKKFLEETYKNKKERKSSAQVAVELRQLADEIDQSELVISGEKLTLIDSFSFSTKKQLKKGAVSCEIYIQSKISSETVPHATVKEKKKPHKKLKSTADKGLKKDISRMWKDVSKSIRAGEKPSGDISSQLLKKCDDYTVCAHKEWFDLWRECAEQIKKCLLSAQNDDFELAKQQVILVNRLTKECHNLYK